MHDVIETLKSLVENMIMAITGFVVTGLVISPAMNRSNESAAVICPFQDT
jgi:hypothetical protein